MAIRLVIVDGHTLHRVGFGHLAGRHPDLEIAGEATSAAGAAGLVERVRPDVVAVDAALPDGDGLSLARALRKSRPGLGIVVLASSGEDDVLFRAMETGASAFVPKTAPEDEIVMAVRHAAVAAATFTAPGLAEAMHRLRESRDQPLLSQRELEVLRLLHLGRSVPDVARELYVSTSTAKTYVSRIYGKLGVGNRAQALLAAMDLGLLTRDPAAA